MAGDVSRVLCTLYPQEELVPHSELCLSDDEKTVNPLKGLVLPENQTALYNPPVEVV